MRGPCFGGGIPLLTGRIVESAIASGPFWKIGESVLIEELEVVVEEFRRELANLNFHCVAHFLLVFLCESIRAVFEDLLEKQGISSAMNRRLEQSVLI
jgi:hypothetical protein